MYRHRKFGNLSTTLFVLTFFISRTCIGTYIYWACLDTFRQALAIWPSDLIAWSIVQLVVCTSSRALNVYWLQLIVRKVFSLDVEPKSKKLSKSRP